MEIKCYDDDILIIECNRLKYSSRFQTLKGKWIDINGKNHFAVGKKYEAELSSIVEDIKKEKEKEHEKESKYNNTESLKLKEEYYKSFNCKPIDFNNELKVGSGKKSIGSLSSSSYGSSSSDGFPSPETPGKKGEDEYEDDDDDELDLEFIIDKLHELEKRIMKLEKRS
jgi:hypothetical protein